MPGHRMRETGRANRSGHRPVDPLIGMRVVRGLRRDPVVEFAAGRRGTRLLGGRGGISRHGGARDRERLVLRTPWLVPIVGDGPPCRVNAAGRGRAGELLRSEPA